MLCVTDTLWALFVMIVSHHQDSPTIIIIIIVIIIIINSCILTILWSLESSCDNSSVPSSACRAVIDPLIESSSLSWSTKWFSYTKKGKGEYMYTALHVYNFNNNNNNNNNTLPLVLSFSGSPGVQCSNDVNRFLNVQNSPYHKLYE